MGAAKHTKNSCSYDLKVTWFDRQTCDEKNSNYDALHLVTSIV